ncbi:MAG: tetratricopeptide repeat protein, partial [Acidobacteria bacterium]|nr:tetratricopeptide repeat protein [Acidobacteriota bacterium]
LDFGLARLHRAAGEAELTATLSGAMTVAGTLPYMAPEQLRGEPVDTRADVWALGAVLYEMATGRRAFPAALAAALAGDILHQAPVRPRQLNPEISAGLDDLILKCLEKDPRKRCQSPKELLAALRALAAPSGISTSPAPAVSIPRRRRRTRRKGIRSLVVLPLTNLSRDPEQEYFADGMTEALMSDLAKLRALKVISRTSAMRYKGTAKSLPEIAEELHVDAVVEGSVLRVGQRVRITAQLIDPVTDTHLWAESYERDFEDVLLLQSELARAIAQEIKVAVTPEEARRLANAPRVNPEAYEAYLKGRFHWYKLSREHADIALDYFQLALEKDPNYALAYAGIADTWLIRGDIGLMPPREAFPKMKAAALKALELDDTLAEVHLTLGHLRLGQWDWSGAEVEFQRAIQLNPNDAGARLFYSDLLISVGRSQEARAEMQRALELDPFNFFFQCFFGWHLVYLRRYDDAIAQLHKTLRMEPNFSSAHMGLWGAFYQKRMYEEALAEAKKFFMVLGDHEIVEALAGGCAEAGYAGAMRAAAEKLEARSKLTYIPAIRIARLYAHAGEKESALDWLEKAYEQGVPPLSHLRVAWDWDILRDDPRFQDLLRRMKLPQ